MTVRYLLSLSSLLVAVCLAGCAALSQTPSGFSVSESQVVQVAAGMSVGQVRALLGHPTQFIKYRNQPGPTMTYRVLGTGDMVFDVDFDANGEVLSTSIRTVPIDADSDRTR